MHAPYLEQSSSSHYRDDKLRTSNMTSKSFLQPKSVSEKKNKSRLHGCSAIQVILCSFDRWISKVADFALIHLQQPSAEQTKMAERPEEGPRQKKRKKK